MPPVMCYGAENWQMINSNISKVSLTQRAMERGILGILIYKRKEQIRQIIKTTDLLGNPTNLKHLSRGRSSMRWFVDVRLITGFR